MHQPRTARVAAGSTWGDVDHATHAFGLAAVSGIISTTGVSGLTLGGGHGHLTRKYGLTIDNLLEADVVLADGRLVADAFRTAATPALTRTLAVPLSPLHLADFGVGKTVRVRVDAATHEIALDQPTG